MTDLLLKLLGIDGVPSADPDVRFEFAHSAPAWAWFLALVACIALAAWSYARLDGSRPIRVILASIRTLALLAVNADPRASDTNITDREQVRAYLAAALPSATPDTQIAFTDQPAPPSDPANPSKPAPDPRSPFPAWLLLAAAACAIIELTLARVFSHARRLSPGLSASIAARNTARSNTNSTARTSNEEHQAA